MKCETWSSFKTMCNQSEIQFWVLHSQEQIGEEIEQIVEDVEQIVEEEEVEIVEEEEQIMEEDERIVFDPLDECDDAGMTTEEVEIIEEEENIIQPTQETVKMVFAKPVTFKVKDLNDPKKPKKRIRKVSEVKDWQCTYLCNSLFCLSLAAWIHGDYFQDTARGQTRNASQMRLLLEHVPTIYEYREASGNRLLVLGPGRSKVGSTRKDDEEHSE